MINFSSGVGLVPEQAWEDPDLAASPYGSDPATASIGFTDGKAAGSASPLTWAQAQELRLIVSLGTGRNVDTPALTTARYVTSGAPGALPVTITAPAQGSTLATASTTVTGTTAPSAAVTVAVGRHHDRRAGRGDQHDRGADGSFSATVPVSFGSNAITVAATATGGRSTGYAQVTVTNEGGGSTVLDVTDPTGDDNGPGHLPVPDHADFHAGAFDLTRFQVLSDGTFAYLRATLRNLDPDVRGDRRGAAARRLRARAGRLGHLHPGRVRLPQLRDRAVRRLEPAGRGAGVRVAGVGERRRQHASAPRPCSPSSPTGRSRSRCPRRSSAPRRRAGASAWC